MDERTRFFVCVVATAAALGVVFAAYGALVGVVSRREGRAGGTRIGLSAARAFGRLGGLSPGVEAALVGAVDGLAFGVGLGVVVGAAAGWYSPNEGRVLRPAAWLVAFLVTTAAALGLLASWATRE